MEEATNLRPYQTLCNLDLQDLREDGGEEAESPKSILTTPTNA